MVLGVSGLELRTYLRVCVAVLVGCANIHIYI